MSLLASRRRARGYTTHKPFALDRVDITRVDGIPVTTPARTLIDLARCVSPDVLEDALDDALRRHLVTISILRKRLAHIGTRGRAGTGRLVRLLDERAGLRSVPMSVFETRLFRVLRAAGMPTPVPQHAVETGRGLAALDFAYIDQKVAIEADGFQWHSGRRRWDHDRSRRNALTVLGWTILHVTWPQLRERPDEVVDEIRHVLGKRSASAEPL